MSNNAYGDVTMTLPDATACKGRIYNLKKLGASYTTTIETYSTQTIDGASNWTLTTNYEFITVQSSGFNWYIIGGN